MSGMDQRDAADERIPIGQFARLTGLSIGALRHYDELDLLRPVDVDRFTGYRRYAADQVEIGRGIARLRDLEVPLEEIRAVLGTDDPAEQRRRVADDWDLAAALEGLARAQSVAGDGAGLAATLARAREALESIADPEDRQLIEQDVNSLSG